MCVARFSNQILCRASQEGMTYFEMILHPCMICVLDAVDNGSSRDCSNRLIRVRMGRGQMRLHRKCELELRILSEPG